ncbi:class I adenylate-forming enzyme family protein [Bosea sp. (in: a-proteobacteria)]|uniref:class I adenylate-forming enzyme family protein n=1 Tax=Bosea sp. (in: a-proteobacteria) TaxID=1871050 RepID=UPI0026229757|nr:AMP-binding protein [Bosea sp. (in: a-proteobacteria)]MCO5091319.1 AMP-binding protein [Bosea sp. (in: a-proteobacteria)]
MTGALQGFVDLLRRRADAEPDRVFASFEGASLTFRELDRQSDSCAATLRRQGLGRGDRAVVMMRNALAVLPLLFGLAKAGVVWVPANPRQRGAGLKYLLESSTPRLVAADADLLPEIAASGARLEGVPLIADTAAGGATPLGAILSGDAVFAEEPPGPSAPFALMYTSGTTGRPKGVEVSHAMLRVAAEAAAIVSAVRPGDVLFVWEPLFHIGGAQLLALPLLEEVRLAMVPSFSASRFWEQVRDEKATHIHYLGGILQMLLKQPPRSDDLTHGVRIAWGGGCPPDIWRLFRQRFGVAIHECYGMTETSSIATCNIGGTVGAVGKPLPWFDVVLLGDDGLPAAPGRRGEIAVRAKRPGALFAGYLDNAEATAAAFRDGLFRTGDVGSWDETGDLHFHGRKGDSVRCKGENVSAWEVEHVAAQHPTVEDCAMIGVPSELGEQDIKLFVKPKPDCEVDPAALSDWLEERLAPYQNPRYIATVDGFERTPSERIMKHSLSKATTDCWDRGARSAVEKFALVSAEMRS